jgi:hypothetical protein
LADSLNYYYTTGTPTLKAIAPVGAQRILQDTAGYFAGLAKASGNVYTPGVPTSATTGGVYGGYVFNKYGIEPQEIIEKMLYTSVLYTHAYDIAENALDVTASDKMMAVLGISRAFANSNNAALHPRPDQLIGALAAQRDKADGKGYYSGLSYQMRKLQAATKAGANYQTDQYDAAYATTVLAEYTLMATLINSCKAMQTHLAVSTLSDNDKAKVLHHNSVAVGVLLGLRLIPYQRRHLADDQIDFLLNYLNFSGLAAPTPYKLFTDTQNQLGNVSQVINQITTAYAFTDAQLDDFTHNWVVEQNR